MPVVEKFSRTRHGFIEVTNQIVLDEGAEIVGIQVIIDALIAAGVQLTITEPKPAPVVEAPVTPPVVETPVVVAPVVPEAPVVPPVVVEPPVDVAPVVEDVPAPVVGVASDPAPVRSFAVGGLINTGSDAPASGV